MAAHLPMHVDTEDLINAGVVGLIQAADRYDPARNNRFMTYAALRIRGAVLSELRARDYIGRTARRQLREVEKSYSRLEQVHQREISDQEVAEDLGLTLEALDRIRAGACISFVRLEEVGDGIQNDKAAVLKELAGVQSADALEHTSLKEMLQALAMGIEDLSPREQMVLSLYYHDELTMKEIGMALSITESRVSQIHATAVFHLRRRLKQQGFLEK